MATIKVEANHGDDLLFMLVDAVYRSDNFEVINRFDALDTYLVATGIEGVPTGWTHGVARLSIWQRIRYVLGR